MANKPKLIVILGPTASGKTGLSIQLAKKIDGEIISADSRQVYKYLDIGTEKITEKEMDGIPHHLIDVADPKETFTVADFKKLADKVIADIVKRGKMPILVGGTGFYIQAVVDDVVPPQVAPNPELRKQLEQLTTEQLSEKLKKLDPDRHDTIDTKNPRRLIRAIEIAEALGHVPPMVSGSDSGNSSDNPDVSKNKYRNANYEIIQTGLEVEDGTLKDRINSRLEETLEKGLMEEVKNLHEKHGLSWERLDELGLEYRLASRHLRNEISHDQMVEMMKNELYQYAKRQKTWFKKDKRIEWLALNEVEEFVEKIML